MLDDAIDMIEHEHFGEDQLALRPGVQFPDGIVPYAQSPRAREVLLVLLDPL